MVGQSMRFIVNSMRGVSRILRDVNPELRDVFNAIGEDLFDAILEELRIPGEVGEGQGASDGNEIDVPEIMQRISLRRRGDWPVPSRLGDMPINAIPGGVRQPGQVACVARATGRWHDPDGFVDIAEQVIDFWAAGPKDNRITLILTTSWNSEDFSERFKDRFDSSCSEQHSVTIVYLSDLGFSLQYL